MRAAAARPAPAAAAAPRGGRVKENIIENKKDEMQEYMERAARPDPPVSPADPERIQQSKDARTCADPQPDGNMRVEFKLRSAHRPADHRRGREGPRSFPPSAWRPISRSRRIR